MQGKYDFSSHDHIYTVVSSLSLQLANIPMQAEIHT